MGVGREGEVKSVTTNKKKNPVCLRTILARDLEVISSRNTHWKKPLGLLCAFSTRLHIALGVPLFISTYVALQPKGSFPKDEGQLNLKYF